MPLTPAERQKRYRERLKEGNPEKFNLQQRKNTEQTKRNRKKIAEYPSSDQEIIRKQWRDRKKKSLGAMSRTTKTQFLLMLDFMEKNGDINKTGRMYNSNSGNHCYQRYYLAGKWMELSKQLNSVAEEPSQKRTILRWKKIWSDWKNNTRRKEIKIKNDPMGTKLVLTDVEKRLLAVVRRSKACVNNMEHQKVTDVKMEKEGEPDDDLIMLETENDSLIAEEVEVLEEELLLQDPLLELKQEAEDCTALDELDTVPTYTGSVSPRSSTVSREPALLPGYDNTVQEQDTSEETSEVEIRRKREEELHQLAVAERVWRLRTLRERHALAAQERAWQRQQHAKQRAAAEQQRALREQTLTEQHAAARLQREQAQYQRDLAELQLRRARSAPAQGHSENKHKFLILNNKKTQLLDD